MIVNNKGGISYKQTTYHEHTQTNNNSWNQYQNIFGTIANKTKYS